MIRAWALGAPLAALILAGCGGNDATTAAPTPTQTAASYNVSKCLSQQVAPGVSVASLVVPDTIQIDLTQASGFPNGRKLADPVIDVELAILLLDLTKHSAGTLAGLPLNPAANDLPFRTAFPYLAAPQGNPPIASSAGTTFDFRSDAPTAYVQVDRMGMPAVSTALIHSANKEAYNSDNPSIDATGKWVPELTSSLTDLQNELVDDLTKAGLTSCAVPA